MGNFENHPLYRITHPRSVAFWGASANPTGMGSVQLETLLSGGFEGRVYPIHPKHEEVAGLKAYKSIFDVPETVDLAFFTLPTKVVPDILEDCGKAGVKKAIVVSGGFGEGDDEGKRLQARLVEIAKKYDMRFLGPNCLGVVNTYHNMSTMFLQYDMERGYIGMASQSGSFITQIFTHLEKFGIAFSQAFSVGNEASIDITDCIEYLGDCPNTKVITLYIEAIRRGREFLEVAREVSKKKPIVAYYVGGSKSGRQAALSHTGALAGPDDLYNGLFRQSGVIRANSIEELFDFAYVFGTQPIPKGNRLAILTHSGGPGASAANTADEVDLTLSTFSPQTVDRLKEFLPSTASSANPVDVTFSRDQQAYTDAMPRALLEDPGVDMVFIYFMMPKYRVEKFFRDAMGAGEDAPKLASQFIASQCESVSKLSAEYGKPLLGASFYTRNEEFVVELQNRHFAILSSPERAVRAMGALSRYQAWKNR